ncbi:MAG: THUMP domain-containing protein [Bacteroidales bacterium]
MQYNENFTLIAKTFQGLEEVLAKELTALGAENVEIGKRMVSFTGDKRMMYLTNFSLHTALRILKPIKQFEANNADEVYEAVKSLAWEEFLSVDKTFAVDATVHSEEFRHSMYVSYKVKDAIADYFRDKEGKRPSVSVKNPDIMLNIHINDNQCTLSLDSSGESLHRRGYRSETGEAPLNEVLAAGLIMMTGWQGDTDLIDPMCGSGTIPIEAALIAKNMAPGIFRTQGYAFERWPDFDAELMESIYNDESQEREFEHHIYAYDNNPKMVATARGNIKRAGMTRIIDIEMRDIKDFVQPAEKSVMITNPPYGERISSDNILELYATIGERLKHAFVGGQAWVLSYREECFDQIGLKPTRKIAVLNGELECSFREYEIFEGKYVHFREAGEELDKNKDENSDEKPKKRFNKDKWLTPEEHRLAELERYEKAEAKRKRIEEEKLHPELKAEHERQFHKENDKKSFGDKKPFKKDGEGKSFRKDGERKSFRKDGDGKPFRKDGERKPFKKDGDSKPFRKDGGKKSFDKKGSGKPRKESYPERKKREQKEKGE